MFSQIVSFMKKTNPFSSQMCRKERTSWQLRRDPPEEHARKSFFCRICSHVQILWCLPSSCLRKRFALKKIEIQLNPKSYLKEWQRLFERSAFELNNSTKHSHEFWGVETCSELSVLRLMVVKLYPKSISIKELKSQISAQLPHSLILFASNSNAYL